MACGGNCCGSGDADLGTSSFLQTGVAADNKPDEPTTLPSLPSTPPSATHEARLLHASGQGGTGPTSLSHLGRDQRSGGSPAALSTFPEVTGTTRPDDVNQSIVDTGCQDRCCAAAAPSQATIMESDDCCGL